MAAVVDAQSLESRNEGWLSDVVISLCSGSPQANSGRSANMPADELFGLQETSYLLRSPENAVRLLAALTRARRGRTKAIDVSALRRALGEGG